MDNGVNTEIIPLSTWTPRPGGNMNTPRADFAMVTLGGLYPKVMAIGGVKEGNAYLASIEEWQEEEEKWETSPTKLSTAKSGSGAIAIPPAIICPKK